MPNSSVPNPIIETDARNVPTPSSAGRSNPFRQRSEKSTRVLRRSSGQSSHTVKITNRKDDPRA